MLTTIQRSALVMHSAERMYTLVNDVTAYPQFMDGCQSAEVIECGDGYMVASLSLRKGGVTTQFVTRNRLTPFEEVRLELNKGPFKRLVGVWAFKNLTATACKVSLKLEFEANNQLLGVAANSLFSSVANNLVAALTRRADSLYGA